MIQAISQEIVDLDALDTMFENKNNTNTKEDLETALNILNKDVDND